MPTFATPEPITLHVKLGAGDLVVDASSGEESRVEVRPADPNNPADVAHAEATSVDLHGSTLSVRPPDTHGGSTPSVVVLVQLPEDSNLDVTAGSADTRATCKLRDVAIRGGSGDVSLGNTGNLSVKLASGSLGVEVVDGRADVTSGSGNVRIRELTGAARINTASGDCLLGEVKGDLELTTASGDARIDRAHRRVDGKSASGDLYLGAAMGELVAWNTASGDLRIGVPAGTAALLDVSSLSGDVFSELSGADGPAEEDRRIEIRARSASGDVHISRA